MVNRMSRLRLLVLLANLISLSCVGCQPSKAERLADRGKVLKLFNDFSRLVESPRAAKAIAPLFVDDALPDAKWIESLAGKLVEIDSVEITGDRATVRFSIETMTGEMESTVEWQCVKQAGVWKIASAPTPSS